MATKRPAITELNNDNWDQDEEEEDPGVGDLPIAKPEILQNRVIKKARRIREHIGDDVKKSPFSGFSGFGQSSPWNKLSSGSNKGISDGTSIDDKPSSSPFPWNKAISMKTKADVSSQENKAKTESNMPNFEKVPSSEIEIDSKDSRYFQNIKKLNETFIKWIQIHIAKNPFCNFTPVCKDYQDHVSRLECMFPFSGNSAQGNNWPLSAPEKLPIILPDRTSESAKESGFLFGKKEPNISEEMDYGASFNSNTTNTSTFSSSVNKIAQTPTSSGSPVGPNISFSAVKAQDNNNKEEAKEETDKTPLSINFRFGTSPFDQQNNGKNLGFKFGPVESKPFSFSFSSMPPPAQPSSNEPDDAEDYVPPKNDSAPVVEDDAIYSKRCKVFFKKDNEFKDKGVAMLYLKPFNDKTQLLIRNETHIGTILLNIILQSSLPIQKNGKNNVLIICTPNPPVDPKNPDSKESVPILIRVKTSEDADELLEKLQQHQS